MEHVWTAGRPRGMPHGSHLGKVFGVGAGVDTGCGKSFGQDLLGLRALAVAGMNNMESQGQ